jgi:peptidoglycan/LPS O-acetylase OafA/YrhL
METLGEPRTCYARWTMRDASAGAREDLKPLTSLRFAAALLVFFDHAPATRTFAEHFALGESAVAFFFLLSGFILMVNYHRDFTTGIAWSAVSRFYAARFARVYPMQVVTTILAVIALAICGDPVHSEFGNLWSGLGAVERIDKVLAALMLLQPWTWNATIVLGVNPPAWSIADEAFFYALFPVAAWYALRAFRSFPSAVVLCVAALMWATFALVFAHAPIGSWLSFYFPPVRFLDFFIGMLLGLAYLKRNDTILPFPSVLEAAALAGVAIATALLPRFPGPLHFGLWLMPFSALLISVFARRAGLISKAISHKFFIALGEASFVFYLIHSILLTAMTATFGSGAVMMVPSLAISLALSFALFCWVETPCRKRIRTTLAAKAAAPCVADAA